jgi:hypothetical protein
MIGKSLIRNTMTRPFVQIGTIGKFFSTYREFKKNVKQLIKLSPNDFVTVTRTRRGEWGEWFERWELINEKPTITKQTWL